MPRSLYITVYIVLEGRWREGHSCTKSGFPPSAYVRVATMVMTQGFMLVPVRNVLVDLICSTYIISSKPLSTRCHTYLFLHAFKPLLPVFFRNSSNGFVLLRSKAPLNGWNMADMAYIVKHYPINQSIKYFPKFLKFRIKLKTFSS